MTTLENLVNQYNELSFTHNYIFGFNDGKSVKMAYGTSDDLVNVCCVDYASRGCGNALRFCPTKAQKETLRNREVITLCSREELENQFQNTKYNRGEIFEKMVTELFGQVWTKDNVPFTKDGDITVNGIAYQIKYERATFINEKTLAHLCA